jgi:hypothetical protein
MGDSDTHRSGACYHGQARNEISDGGTTAQLYSAKLRGSTCEDKFRQNSSLYDLKWLLMASLLRVLLGDANVGD